MNVRLFLKIAATFFVALLLLIPVEQIRGLVSERQALHERNANSNELESNRTALAGRQRQLSDALIDSHVRSADGPDSLLAAA